MRGMGGLTLSVLMLPVPALAQGQFSLPADARVM